MATSGDDTDEPTGAPAALAPPRNFITGSEWAEGKLIHQSILTPAKDVTHSTAGVCSDAQHAQVHHAEPHPDGAVRRPAKTPAVDPGSPPFRPSRSSAANQIPHANPFAKRDDRARLARAHHARCVRDSRVSASGSEAARVAVLARIRPAEQLVAVDDDGLPTTKAAEIVVANHPMAACDKLGSQWP